MPFFYMNGMRFRVVGIWKEHFGETNVREMVRDWEGPAVVKPLKRAKVGHHDRIGEQYRINSRMLKNPQSPERGEMAGKPCYIVGNGPSLKENGHLLAGIDTEKSVVIGVNGGIRSCPPGSWFFTIELRAQDAWFLGGNDWFRQYRAALWSHILMFLHRAPWIETRVFNMHLGWHFHDASHEKWPGMMRLDAGLHSTFSAYHLAYLWGCNPIIFVGCDYSYSDEGAIHSHEAGCGDSSDTEQIHVLIGGRQFKTDLNYLRMCRHMMAATMFVGDYGRTVMNATENGIFVMKHPNFGLLDLESCIGFLQPKENQDGRVETALESATS